MITPNQEDLQVGDEVEVYLGNNPCPGKYRIIGVTEIKYYSAELFRVSDKVWLKGHAFSAEDGFSWVLLNRKARPTIVCICMRCNSENKWAIPNRPDNKYLCFECR